MCNLVSSLGVAGEGDFRGKRLATPPIGCPSAGRSSAYGGWASRISRRRSGGIGLGRTVFVCRTAGDADETDWSVKFS